MKFDHNRHDTEKFAYKLNGIREMTGMSDEQISEHSKCGISITQNLMQPLSKHEFMYYCSSQNYYMT